MGWFWESPAPLPTVSGKTEPFECAGQFVQATFVLHLKCRRTDSKVPALMREFPKSLAGMIRHRELDLKTMTEYRDEICEEMIEEHIRLGFWDSFFVEDLVEKIDLSFAAAPKPMPPPAPPEPKVVIKTVVKEVVKEVPVVKVVEKIVYRDPPRPKYDSKVEEEMAHKVTKVVDAVKAAKKIEAKYAKEMAEDKDLNKAIKNRINSLKMDQFDS